MFLLTLQLLAMRSHHSPCRWCRCKISRTRRMATLSAGMVALLFGRGKSRSIPRVPHQRPRSNGIVIPDSAESVAQMGSIPQFPHANAESQRNSSSTPLPSTLISTSSGASTGALTCIRAVKSAG